MFDVGLMEYMENDLITGVTRYGPTNFSSILFKYYIMSSSNHELIGWLSKYLPPRNLSIVLVEILENNVQDPLIFKDFIHVLWNVSPLNYLYNKIYIVFG